MSASTITWRKKNARSPGAASMSEYPMAPRMEAETPQQKGSQPNRILAVDMANEKALCLCKKKRREGGEEGDEEEEGEESEREREEEEEEEEEKEENVADGTSMRTVRIKRKPKLLHTQRHRQTQTQTHTYAHQPTNQKEKLSLSRR